MQIQSKENVIFVSAGMINSKKEGSPVAKEHAYLNYGLLGLASIVKSKGHNAILLHGKFQEPDAFLKKHAKYFKYISQYPLFLSLPSSFSLEWAQKFVILLKKQYKDISIVVGGRWAVMEDGKWIKDLFENKIDIVVYGLAENRIEKLLDKSQWHNIPYTDWHKDLTQEVWQGNYPKNNYSLMPDYKEFQPSIDVSRGCGRRCSFCLEGKAKLEKLKEPIHVVEEIKELIKLYKTDKITPYFEASHFNPSKEWANEFANLILSEQISIKWRAETRVDSITESILSVLAQSGLKILDIGLESASIVQLERMKKAKRPNEYLKKASAFLENCKKYDIWAKVNILLYPGENKETIAETKQWLDIECIKGVSVNPLMVYRNQGVEVFLEELKINYGAFPVENTILQKGFCYMNLSSTMLHNEIEEVRIEFCQRYMTAEDYYDLKSFSYFTEESLTKDEFIKRCKLEDGRNLPFRMNN